jgi:putative spermidine/putrescine transport system substrate-binding protein
MDRRSFLIGTGTVALSQILAGCGNQNQATLNVKFLKGSVPNQVVKAFRTSIKQSASLEFATVAQLENLFDDLQSWQQKNKKPDKERSLIPGISWQHSTKAPDILTIGDYWLAAAIKQKLIQPIDPTLLQQWSNLPLRWQELVTRNDLGQPNRQGKVWAAPYRWGYTMIAYNRDKFQSLGWQPKDWGDLWREECKGRISLLNHPREVIGLTLKTLGKSYNTENLSQVPDLEQQLRRLHQQVKFYSSDTYLQPLILEDTWLAVGWSNDLLPVIQRYRQFDAVIPTSGTALWADLWVLPSSTASQPLNQNWIDFCWQPQIAQQISLLSKANSPIPLELNQASIQAKLRPLLIPNPKILKLSEFLLPLSQETRQHYQSLWQEMRG